MHHQRYVVRKGDCLWDLAERFLGSPWEWPRIYAYNNRASIVQLTGRGIKNPDLIYIDQVLYIPVLQGCPISLPKKKPSKPQPVSLKDQVHKITVPFVVGYRLDELPLMLYEDVFLKASIKLSGKVAIRLGDNVPLAHATNRGLEMTYATQAENVLNRLFQETAVQWDKGTNMITYRSLMVSASTTPHVPSTAVGLSVSSHKPTPVLRGEIRYPTLSGYVDHNFYTAMDARVVIELEPKVPPVAKGPDVMSTDPVFKERILPNQSPSGNTVAWKLIGDAALILTATILTDFIFGVGIFDDFVTIPAALTMMGRGVSILVFPIVACGAGSFVCKTVRTATSEAALKVAHVQ